MVGVLVVVAIILVVGSTDSGDSSGQSVGSAIACDFEDAVGTIFASTVQVFAGESAGTGFYVGESRFVTAAHVVKGVSTVRLLGPGVSLSATVSWADSETDVAVLSVARDPMIARVAWGDRESVNPGQVVGVAGYPEFVNDSPSVATGRVSKVFEDPRFGPMIQTDAPVNPGNSGGAVFDQCGLVVGMIIARPDSTAIEGIGFAVAESTVRTVLANAVGARSGDASTARPAATTAPTSTPRPTATAVPAQPRTPTAPQTTFGDGQFFVGSQIAPGTYRTTTANSSCIFKGDGSSVVFHQEGSVTVVVSATWSTINSRDCGTWQPID